jgi:hypothetical protein
MRAWYRWWRLWKRLTTLCARSERSLFLISYSYVTCTRASKHKKTTKKHYTLFFRPPIRINPVSPAEQKCAVKQHAVQPKTIGEASVRTSAR